MRTYIAKMPPMSRALLTIPLLIGAYPVVMILIPAMVHAMVPNVVRSLLKLI